MKKSKPIEAGNWVFWHGGLFKVIEIKDECVPKCYMQGRLAVRPHGLKVAVLEPIRVSEHVLRWYREDEFVPRRRYSALLEKNQSSVGPKARVPEVVDRYKKVWYNVSILAAPKGDTK